MCLAIPMQIVESDGHRARCVARGGVGREVSLFLLAPGTVGPGDFVIVHVGYAIEKIVAGDARTTWQMLDDMDRTAPPQRDA